MKLLLPLMIVLAMAMFGQAVETCSPCPQSWSYFRGQCYRYFGDRVTWEEAKNRCKNHHSFNGQAHLLSIFGSEENDFAYDLFRTSAGVTPDRVRTGPPYYGAWIGLYQETPGSTRPFIWSDSGAPASFESWLPGQPDNNGNNEDCAHFWRRNARDDTSRSWNDLLCSRELPYICKVQPN